MVTQVEFAKRRGVTPKTCQIWRHQGLIVFAPSGGVDVEASEKLIDARPETFRGGKVKPKPAPSAEICLGPEPLADPALVDVPAARPETFRGGTVKPKPPSQKFMGRSEPLDDPALADVPPAVIDEAATWPLREATRKKEIALALLRQLEYDKESGLVVPIADVAKEVAAEYTIVRDRVLAIPGKLADELAGMDRRGIEARLRRECHECLSELHDRP